MGLGILTRTTRNGYANLVSPRSAPVLKNTVSPSHLQKLCSSNGVVSGAIVKKGGFPNPKLFVGTRVFSNALWKGRSSIPLTIRNSRFYNSFRSLDSRRRSVFRTDGAVIGLIATNVAVFLLWRVVDNEFMAKNFMISLENLKGGRLHTLVTSGFTHCDTLHFVTNMIGLCLFGTSIGRSLGQRYLLVLYLSGAIAGSIANLGLCSKIDSSLLNGQGVSYSIIPLQSASGAVYPIVAVGVCQLLIKTPSLATILSQGIFGNCLIITEFLRLVEGNSFAILGGSVVSGVVCYKYLKMVLRIV